MGVTQRTLVILLSMHRSGSSLTARVMQRLGMSLGPFDLMGATPSNPHGHFEAMPFYWLNRKVQELLHGFKDDMPATEDSLKTFLENRGSCDPTVAIPEELIGEGRELLAALIDSGTVLGFKDPRTILTWPFWRRVLAAFPDVRVVPVALVRSPHQIAMSLFARSEGSYGYWSCLDLIAVHLRQLQAIIQDCEGNVPVVRFGHGRYLEDLAAAAESCGLPWNPAVAQGSIDEACIHHAPAIVAHEAQELYQSLACLVGDPFDSATNQARLIADECIRETIGQRRSSQLQARLEEIEHQLHQTRAQREAASLEAEQTRDELARALDQLRDAEDQSLRSCADALELLERSRAESRELLERSRAEIHELRSRLEQFETHFVLGPALRGRRRLKKAVEILRDRAAL